MARRGPPTVQITFSAEGRPDPRGLGEAPFIRPGVGPACSHRVGVR